MHEESYYREISKELLRALRSQRSQGQINRKLNTTYNKVSRWESGATVISWEDFRTYCSVLEKDLHLATDGFFSLKESEASGEKIVEVLVDLTPLSEISKYLNSSISSLKRWLDGSTDVKLFQILALIDYRGKLPHFINSLIDIKNVPTLYEVYQKQKEARELFSNYPEASLLMLGLSLKRYITLEKHSLKSLASFIHLEVEKTEKIFDLLIKYKLVLKEGELYRENPSYLNFSWTTEDEIKHDNLIKKFWTQYAFERMPEGGEFYGADFRTGFEIFFTNDKIKRLIHQEITKFRLRIHQILESEDGIDGDELFLLNSQFLNLTKKWPKI